MKTDYDYVVVGSGLAGISFCEQLRTNKKTFVVFDDNSQKSSTVAGGLYNPVVLKRFTPVWKSEEQLAIALPMYRGLEALLKVKLDHKIPVYRKFASVEEQNNWFAASDKLMLSKKLSNTIIPNKNKEIRADYGFGEVLHTGRIDTKTLVESYKAYLSHLRLIYKETFDYEALNVQGKGISYKGIAAKHIVFAEGFGVTKNPFFKDLPLVPTKGELITIYAPDLKIDFVLKGPVFLIPIGKDLYLVGATHEWEDLTHDNTDKAKVYLLEKLQSLISCEYQVVKQVAGIRPTVKGRRPLVGQHPNYKNMYVLNGLGTRGVMIGPYVAQQLLDFIEKGKPLDDEINIKRFASIIE